ncbi:PAS domain S-box protein [Colwellia sp. MSW7]|uniref:PAS domain S-box protein n=1 Tax=Colwellia maritima TaxID=2912588 RepID=A0ABS9X142_9GAMM|nr:PAS domain-containing protein [Colwellia maritima]MCI2283884.1 PAS domain S-box protein [Colwellia maritima]
MAFLFLEFADIFELSTLDGEQLTVEQWPLARVLRGETLSELELCVKNSRDGWQGIFSFGGTIVNNDIGNALVAIITINDITEEKQAEINLRIAAVSFESQESIMITDAENRILRVNSAFTETTGYSAAEIVGKSPSLLKSGRHDAEFFQAMWESINDTGSRAG